MVSSSRSKHIPQRTIDQVLQSAVLARDTIADKHSDSGNSRRRGYLI